MKRFEITGDQCFFLSIRPIFDLGFSSHSFRSSFKGFGVSDAEWFMLLCEICAVALFMCFKAEVYILAGANI